MIQSLAAKIFGTKNEREVKRLLPQVEAINALEPEMQKLSDEQLREKTEEFRRRIQERLAPLPEGPEADPERRKQLSQERLQAINEVLNKTGLHKSDIDMLICHQANLRISQFIQKTMDLPDDKVWNNIQRYGNTTAASIPIALAEAYQAGKIKQGDLICLAAFGSGFTWGASLIRW